MNLRNSHTALLYLFVINAWMCCCLHLSCLHLLLIHACVVISIINMYSWGIEKGVWEGAPSYDRGELAVSYR